jgi:hypothetical protein
MIIEKLKEKLDNLGVAPNRYSLFGELNFDAIILYNNYNKWNVFYLDERGNRIDEKCFDNETEACSYIYKIFKDARGIEEKYRINTE